MPQFHAEAHNNKATSDTNPLTIPITISGAINAAHMDITIRMIGAPAQSLSSLTYSGQNCTFRSTHTSSTDNFDTVEHWFVSLGNNPAQGLGNIIATPTAACRMIGNAVVRYNVSQTTPYPAVDSFVNDAGVPVTAITQTVSAIVGELVVDIAAPSGGNTITASGLQIERTNFTSTDTWGSSEQDGSATITMAWTISAADQWISLVWRLSPGQVTTDQTISGLSNLADPLSQKGRPGSDVTLGSWISSIGQPLYTTISGLIAGDPQWDSSPNSAGNTFEVKISGLVTPINVSGHVVTIHVRGDNPTATLTVGLYEGAGLIQQEVFTGLTTSFATRAFLVTPANASTIVNYQNLRLRFTAGP